MKSLIVSIGFSSGGIVNKSIVDFVADLVAFQADRKGAVVACHTREPLDIFGACHETGFKPLHQDFLPLTGGPATALSELQATIIKHNMRVLTCIDIASKACNDPFISNFEG